jgi:hypothetical protein
MKSIGNYGTGGSNIILRNRQLNFVNLVATITDTRVHEDTLILVYYSEATQAAAQAAGITTETNEGNITFTAANPPSSTIVCDVVLLSANIVSQMASASDIDYNNIASGLTATDVQGAVDELAESYPADKVMMSDGVTNVEEAVDEVVTIHSLTPARSSISVVSGGYLKIGKMIIISAMFDITETITNPNVEIFNNLPNASIINYPLTLSENGGTIIADDRIRVYSTNIYSGTSLTANKRYVIRGIYHSA